MRYSALNDEMMTYLANSLSNNSVLRYLNLSNPQLNHRVTASGWTAFSAVLENPNSALEKLDLVGCIFDDDALVSFANTLTHNSNLKELLFDEDLDQEYDGEIAITNWGAFPNVLCNKSSILATFNSNHTLQRVLHLPCERLIDQVDESQLQRTLLQLNRENTPTEAARRKILKMHFSGTFSMQPFIDMDSKALPYAVAWMARDEYGFSLLYQFVRNTTLFFDIGGATKSENRPGSKRQKI